MNVTELLQFGLGAVYAHNLKAGDVILRDAIGGQRFVHVTRVFRVTRVYRVTGGSVTRVYRVTGGSRTGGLAVEYVNYDGGTGHFYPVDTETVLRAYWRGD